MVIKRELVFALLEGVCDEMGRQGITRIILLSGHGGNRYFLPLLVQTLSEKECPYCVYCANLPRFEGRDELLETGEYGHACEAETSDMLHIAPELVKMDSVPEEPFRNLERNRELKEAGAYSPMDWYAMYPNMYVGDASKASAEKGQVMCEHRVTALAKLIRAVKEDEVTEELMEQFALGVKEPRSPY